MPVAIQQRPEGAKLTPQPPGRGPQLVDALGVSATGRGVALEELAISLGERRLDRQGGRIIGRSVGNLVEKRSRFLGRVVSGFRVAGSLVARHVSCQWDVRDGSMEPPFYHNLRESGSDLGPGGDKRVSITNDRAGRAARPARPEGI